VRRVFYEHELQQRRHADLLQGLGNRPADCFLARLPLSADDWDTQMLFFLKHGYRVIAHDRRGHGRSSQPVTAMTWIITPTT